MLGKRWSQGLIHAPPPAAVSGAAAACASVRQALPRAPSKARSPHSATTGAHGGGNGLR